MKIKNFETYPIVVLVLSILIFDDLNLVLYILEQEFQDFAGGGGGGGYFPRLSLMLLIRDGSSLKSLFRFFTGIKCIWRNKLKHLLYYQHSKAQQLITKT